VLLVAIAAVNRPGSVRLEGDLSLLPALRTGYVCHLSWSTVKAATATAAAAVSIISLEHLIHVPFVSIQRIEPATKIISIKIIEPTQCSFFIKVSLVNIPGGQISRNSADMHIYRATELSPLSPEIEAHSVREEI
jgi:hypothetical protein